VVVVVVLIIPDQGKLVGQEVAVMELKALVLELPAKVTQAVQHIGRVAVQVVLEAEAVLVQ
jgi:hypothetical protein